MFGLRGHGRSDYTIPGTVDRNVAKRRVRGVCLTREPKPHDLTTGADRLLAARHGRHPHRTSVGVEGAAAAGWHGWCRAAKADAGVGARLEEASRIAY